MYINSPQIYISSVLFHTDDIVLKYSFGFTYLLLLHNLFISVTLQIILQFFLIIKA